MFERKQIYRTVEEGSTFFVTSNTFDRVTYFYNEGACRVLLENIKTAKKVFEFQLWAFIIMPDHFHMLLTTTNEKTISDIMHFIKRNTSRNINIMEKVKFAINKAPLPYFVMEDNYPPLQNCAVSKRIEDDHPPLQERVRSMKEVMINSKIIALKNVKIEYGENFKWQKSFHDTVIDFDQAFQQRKKYINQKNLSDLIDIYGYLNIDIGNYPFYSYTNLDLIDHE